MKRLAFFFLALCTGVAFAQIPGPPQPPSSGSYNDQSAIVGSLVNLTSHASRFNHLLVGEVSTKNSSLSSSPMSWMDSLIGNSIVGSQIGVTSTVGGGAIGAASRSSDFHTVFGGASAGSAGAYLFGVNDDNSAGSIALGSNSVGIHRPGAAGATLGAQQDINSAIASSCVPTADSIFCSGSGTTTIGNLITNGAFSSLGTQDISTALAIGGQGPNAQRFLTGLMVDSTAIRAGQGPSILGSNSTVAVGMPASNYIIWYGSGNTALGAVWTGSSGNLNLFGSNVVINGVSAVSCSPGTINPATVTITNGIVTHC